MEALVLVKSLGLHQRPGFTPACNDLLEWLGCLSVSAGLGILWEMVGGPETSQVLLMPAGNGHCGSGGGRLRLL